MKKMIMSALFISALFCSHTSWGQKLIGGDNIIKTNISADALNNLNISYERNILPFVSIMASYRTMPLSSLPLKSIAKNFIKTDAIDFDQFKIGNNAITLESRFYLGIQKMSGFYIAPYYRSANFDLDLPVAYTYSTGIPNVPAITQSAKFNGSLRSQSLGVYVGMQFQLLTKLVIDFWMVGGHYGSTNGSLDFIPPTASTPLPDLAQQALQKSLNDIKASPFTIKSTVNAYGAKADLTGPWAGFRGAGLTLGLRF
jgi:hypothetical protein